MSSGTEGPKARQAKKIIGLSFGCLLGAIGLFFWIVQITEGHYMPPVEIVLILVISYVVIKGSVKKESLISVSVNAVESVTEPKSLVSKLTPFMAVAVALFAIFLTKNLFSRELTRGAEILNGATPDVFLLQLNLIFVGGLGILLTIVSFLSQKRSAYRALNNFILLICTLSFLLTMFIFMDLAS